MLSHTKVSIVIPIWNAAANLTACLESVTTQTLQDIEVICVDDGSTDRSREVIRTYASRDSRLRLICQSHRGAGKARNRALVAATGRYVAFIDADDVYPSQDTLEHMFDAACSSRVAVCGGTLIVVRGQSRSLGTVNTGPIEVPQFTNEILMYQDYQVDYGFTLFIYLRALLVRHAIRFPPYARFQDPPFFVKAMQAAVKFMGLSIPTYCHRRGHRKVEWSDAQTADMIRGIRDNLRFSQRHSLERLHALSAWRLREEYGAIIQAACARGAISVRRILQEAERSVVPDLIKGQLAPRSVL
jgi:glycosyltransferase involved in cell wall biosynthesis